MDRKTRVLWLLNHFTLRSFEIEQFGAIGIGEVFTPKSFPYDEGNLSASITYEYDENLSIPKDDLAVLNAQDWYSEPSEAAWKIANKYFDVAVIGFFPRQIKSTSKFFQGAIVLRVFGLSKGYSYSELMLKEGSPYIVEKIKRCGKRFWFGAGYEHLADCELNFLSSRNCFLPVGLSGKNTSGEWEGRDTHILFVCPRIGSSPYFNKIYKDFLASFADFDCLIGGAQPIAVDDERVIGFVSKEQHEHNMKQSRVMFYHSTEPNHIHYHPFEAIRAGMPLVFMAGGMLDSMGGIGLPGRCETIAEAREKIQRILNDDWSLIKRIRESQSILLEPMKPENCAQAWRIGFKKILDELTEYRVEQTTRPMSTLSKRIAVIVPVAYRGGSLRGAKLMAQALQQGSRQYGEATDVVLVHLDQAESYPEEEFSDLPADIKRRKFHWKTLSGAEARRAMRYAGFEGWEPTAGHYIVPDDSIKQLQDCDLWLVISDRLVAPLLPIRPVVLMVYDYLQRYVTILPGGADQPFLEAARHAERVLVSTEFTRQDALQYAGIEQHKVIKVPMLAPDFSGSVIKSQGTMSPFFVWTTNAAPHKNHENAAKALRIYYEELHGQLRCVATGVETQNILKRDLPHLKAMAAIFKQSSSLKQNVVWKGELPDTEYRKLLSASTFLWHAGKIDNGTFSVIEAAWLGTPALSSDYPAMREIDEQFGLNLTWMDAHSPADMAKQLKFMEENSQKCSARLPSVEQLASQNVENLAIAYWKVVRECL